MESVLAFELANSLHAPHEARTMIAPLKDAIGEPVHADLTLLVSEIIGNSVRHAGLQEGQNIRVRIAYARGWARAEVVDGGRGFDPPPDVRPLAAAVSGYGLLLLSRLAVRWNAERTDDGMVVSFELTITDPTAAPARRPAARSIGPRPRG